MEWAVMTVASQGVWRMKLTNVWKPANDSVRHFKGVLGIYFLIDNPKYCNTKACLLHGICAEWIVFFPLSFCFFSQIARFISFIFRWCEFHNL